eukprot:scaffold264147_cov30-Tisochrysis_lutea.AAC.2
MNFIQRVAALQAAPATKSDSPSEASRLAKTEQRCAPSTQEPFVGLFAAAEVARASSLELSGGGRSAEMPASGCAL